MKLCPSILKLIVIPKNAKEFSLEISYTYCFTREEELDLKKYFRWRAKNKVPVRKIKVSPRAGDYVRADTMLKILKDKPFDDLLQCHFGKRAPHVIAFLAPIISVIWKK